MSCDTQRLCVRRLPLLRKCTLRLISCLPLLSKWTLSCWPSIFGKEFVSQACRALPTEVYLARRWTVTWRGPSEAFPHPFPTPTSPHSRKTATFHWEQIPWIILYLCDHHLHPQVPRILRFGRNDNVSATLHSGFLRLVISVRKRPNCIQWKCLQTKQNIL